MVKYPTEMPVDSVQTLVQIIKDRAINSRRAEFGLAVWNVQGFVQEKALGDGAINVMGTLSDEQALAHAESLVVTVPGAMQSVEWTMLLPLVKWALLQLASLL